MIDSQPRSRPRRLNWWPLALTLIAFSITEVPFELGHRWAPPGTVFDGLTGMTHDQNMYFSFIRQGAEGRWLFSNRLTHVEHEPAMLNLEWLAVGRLIAWLGGNVRLAYAIWRLVGTALLVYGFWCLAEVIGLSLVQRRVGAVLCAFGGGFGWIFLSLDRVGLIAPMPIAMLDISDATHPFSHIFFNPHISLSHGFSLFTLAAYCAGEKTGKLRWYAVSSLLAAVHGLIRPYDLILLFGAVPLFLFIELVVERVWSWQKTIARGLPLLVTAPVVAYNAALFQLHPVFKYWASQGVVKPFPIHWHFLSLGIAGVLFAVRLCLIRRYPLKSPSERFLVAWLAGVLFLFHGHKFPWLSFMPYTPVFGATLPSVMLILGIAVIDPRFFPEGHPGWKRISLLTVFVFVSSLGSVVWMAKICRNLANLPEHYIPGSEYESYVWLENHAEPSDVIVSSLYSGNRMAKYVSARFALGHLAVTPHVHELSRRVEQFYEGALTVDEAKSLLRELHARWIYRGPLERDLGSFDPAAIPGVVEQHTDNDVQVYSFQPVAAMPAHR
jgi:hypothetical protein